MVSVTVLSTMAALAAIAGGFSTLVADRERMADLAALASGLMVGGAVGSMLPHLMHEAQGPLAALAGFGAMLLLRGAMSSAREAGWGGAAAGTAGLALHSLADGAAMGLALQADAGVGLVTFLGVALHKVPEGFTAAALSAGATGSRLAGLLGSGLVALATLAGALLPVLWARLAGPVQPVLLGLAAGSYLYMGAAEMLPTAVRRGRAWYAIAGILLIAFLTRGHHH